MTNLMTKQEIKDQAQSLLLNDGAGAFIFVHENCIEPLERDRDSYKMEIDENELANWKAVDVEMEKQFDRMIKFFGFVSFNSSH